MPAPITAAARRRGVVALQSCTDAVAAGLWTPAVQVPHLRTGSARPEDHAGQPRDRSVSLQLLIANASSLTPGSLAPRCPHPGIRHLPPCRAPSLQLLTQGTRFAAILYPCRYTTTRSTPSCLGSLRSARTCMLSLAASPRRASLCAAASRRSDAPGWRPTARRPTAGHQLLIPSCLRGCKARCPPGGRFGALEPDPAPDLIAHFARQLSHPLPAWPAAWRSLEAILRMCHGAR